MKTGIELITEERQKQIDKHGFTAEHHFLNSDKWYSEGQLIDAAIKLLYKVANDFVPKNWDPVWFSNLCDRPHEERLVIAGALIASHIDLINYTQEQKMLESVKGNGKIYRMEIQGEINHVTAVSKLAAIKGYCRDMGSEYLDEIESVEEVDLKTALSISILDDGTGITIPLLQACLNPEGKIYEEFLIISTDAV